MEKCGLFENEKRNHNSQIYHIGENYLTIRWPNCSQIGSGAADLELKTYAQLVEIFISRKRAKCIFGGFLPRNGIITPKRQC